MRSILAVTVVTLQLATSAEPPFVVERSRVGPVAIGATAQSLYEAFRDRARLVDLKLEGMLSPALELRLYGARLAPSIIAEISPVGGQQVVTRIHVFDPSLRTKEGIGVGSTYGELRARYAVDWVAWGESSFIARVESQGMSFELDPYGPQPLWSIRDQDKVPNDVRIVSIMLTR